MKEIKFKIITLLLSIILTGIIYGDVLINPNNYLFCASGDGIKNYYTSHYFVKHGELSFHTNGMNYPYAELISFTDNQPSISWFLQIVKKTGLDVSDHIIGIYNLLMLLSISIAALFYYLIARKIVLPPLYAITVAIIISFLSPQVERFTGHYSLGYVCFVPVLWYLLIRAFENKYSVRYGLYILMYNLFFGFIHPYYVLIGTMFSVLYVVCNFIYLKEKWSAAFLQVLLAALPPVILQFIFSRLDSVVDRPTNPWGLLDYATRFEGLFIPVFSPFLDIWNALVKVRSTDIETHSYVGVLGAVVFILSLIKIVKYIRKKKYKYVLKPILPVPLRTSLLVSILMLLFAMAIPFRMGLGFLLEIAPAIKQFRSLGRFAWVFYSVFTMYSAFYLYLIVRKWNIEKRRKKSFVLLISLLIIWATEAYINNYHTLQIIRNKTADSYYTDSTLKQLGSLGVDINRFQSILPLPMYLIGSEVIGIHNDHSGIVFQSMKISSATGLPISATMLSRTSLSQTINLATLVADSLIDRSAYLKDISTKDILLVTKGQELPSGEQFVLSKAHLFFTDEEGFSYYSLSPSSLKQNKYFVDGTEFIAEKEDRNILGKHDWYYWNTYNNNQLFVNKDNSLLFEGTVLGSGEYECSFWLKLTNKHIVPRLILEKYDSSKKLVEQKLFDCGVFANTDREWIRVSNVFTFDEHTASIKYSLKTEGDTIRSLLIKPLKIKVLTKGLRQERVDNFPLN